MTDILNDAVVIVPPFPMVSARELTAKPVQIDWLIKGILERQSLNLLFGEAGAGKSLFALDWGFCIAHGMSWNGLKTKQGDVCIIAGEGFAGMARRIKALESKYSTLAPERLFISQKPAQLTDANNASWVADSVRKLSPNPSLVVIDTLHRNFDGDENSSQDIGAFINNLDEYFKPLGAAVLVVHHSGHGDKARSRGSSSIKAAMDGEFSAVKSEGFINLACSKSKDFEALKPLRFALKPVELDWVDDEGEPQTSVHLEFAGEASTSKVKKHLSKSDDAVLTSLMDAIRENGISAPSDIRTKFAGFKNDSHKVISLEAWRPYGYKAAITNSDTAEAIRQAFNRSKNALLKLDKIQQYNGFCWVIHD